MEAWRDIGPVIELRTALVDITIREASDPADGSVMIECRSRDGRQLTATATQSNGGRTQHVSIAADTRTAQR